NLTMVNLRSRSMTSTGCAQVTALHREEDVEEQVLTDETARERSSSLSSLYEPGQPSGESIAGSMSSDHIQPASDQGVPTQSTANINPPQSSVDCKKLLDILKRLQTVQQRRQEIRKARKTLDEAARVFDGKYDSLTTLRDTYQAKVEALDKEIHEMDESVSDNEFARQDIKLDDRIERSKERDLRNLLEQFIENRLYEDGQGPAT
ncbi:MAG: hypothetical protein Q9180_007587, partial [Flavoplaca navasiana]